MTVHWAVVPARGGSKSIPRKNLLVLDGRPLLDYCVRAAQASRRFARIVCSTDDSEIAARARELGIEVDSRPDRLATDDALVDDAVRELLDRHAYAGETLPDVVALVQPTSPFVLPEHIGAVLDLLERDRDARSAHNCAVVRHNLHAWNQRQIDDRGRVTFLFREERLAARSKQRKPTMLAFGNVLAARASALLAGDGFYAEPGAGTEIAPPFDFDLDRAEDIPVAEALIRSGAVPLAHLDEPAAPVAGRRNESANVERQRL